MTTLAQLVADLLRAPDQIVHRGRGVTAAHVDAAVARAKPAAVDWPGDAHETMRGRMSRDQSEVVGYLMADGFGAFAGEHGTSRTPPNPVMWQSAQSQVDPWADGLADLAEDVLS